MRLPRFQFGLATLLLAISWSSVVLWLNIRPREVFHLEFNAQQFKHVKLLEIGWPWGHLNYLDIDGVAFYDPLIPDYWALAGDTAVGVLFVALLTVGPALLLHRAGGLIFLFDPLLR